ncbi:MAG TPA: MATE family efflux transporter [Gemmatimonadaceae bacterium]|nr:MATE family efflux transporter [Gemmatimonadaceae bacterium]
MQGGTEYQSVVPPHARTLRGEARALATLAVPVVVVQVGMMAMGVVDTMMIGRVSATALAAVALGHLYFFISASFGMGTLMALDPIVSQAMGAGDQLAVRRGMQRGLVLAVCLTIPMTIVLWLAEPVLSVLRQPPGVVPIAAGYVRASILGMLPFLVFTVLRQSLQAMKRMAPIVWTIILANLANVLLNWMLVYGRLGAPELGAVGTGWASSISRVIMALGLLALAWHGLRPYLLPPRRDALAILPLVRMLRVGAPIGGQFVLEGGLFTVVALLMGVLGPIEVAAHHVALNMAALTFMVPLGISAAATVLVGHAVGRNDAEDARGASKAALVLGTGFMATMAVVMLTMPELLARAYTSDRAVIALAAVLIPIAGVFQVFDGLQVVSIGLLRGLGDTRTPLIVNLLGFWLLGLPVSLWLAFRLDYGPRGLWWGLVVGLAAVAFALLSRVRARLSQEMRRLVIDEEQLNAELRVG